MGFDLFQFMSESLSSSPENEQKAAFGRAALLE